MVNANDGGALPTPGMQKAQGKPPAPGSGGAPPPPPQQYQGGPQSGQGQDKPALTYDESAKLKNPPAVPGQHGGPGKTTVDTPSLDLFASNVEKLIPTVQDAYSRLATLTPVYPGSFYDARVLTNSLLKGGSSAQIPAYQDVLQNLMQGLAQIKLNADTASKKYKSTEDLAKASAADIQDLFGDSATAFSAMAGANGGGSGGTGGGGGGTGGGAGAGGGA